MRILILKLYLCLTNYLILLYLLYANQLILSFTPSSNHQPNYHPNGHPNYYPNFNPLTPGIHYNSIRT